MSRHGVQEVDRHFLSTREVMLLDVDGRPLPVDDDEILLRRRNHDQIRSNVIPSAPRGGFGALAVGTASDLSIIAPVVLNSFNALVGGATSRMPTFQASDAGGMKLTSNSSAGAVSEAAAVAGQQGSSEQPSNIIVEVIGYDFRQGEPKVTARTRGRSHNRKANVVPKVQTKPGCWLDQKSPGRECH